MKNKRNLLIAGITSTAVILLVFQAKGQKTPIKAWPSLVANSLNPSKVDAQWEMMVTKLPTPNAQLDLQKYEAERSQANKADTSLINPDEVTKYEVDAQKANIQGYTSTSKVRIVSDATATATITNSGPEIFPGYTGGPAPVSDYLEFYDGVHYIFPLSYTDEEEPTVEEYELNKDGTQALAASGANGIFGQAFLRVVPLDSIFDVEEFDLESESEEQVVLVKKADNYIEKLTFSKLYNKLSNLEVADLNGNTLFNAQVKRFGKFGDASYLPTNITKQEFFIDQKPQLVTEFKLIEAQTGDEVKLPPISLIPTGSIINDKRFGEGENQNVRFRFNGRIPSDKQIASQLEAPALIPDASSLPRAEDNPNN